MMEIAAITGHTNMRTLQRYTHRRPQIMADKLEKPFVIGIL
jgi:hypothetical protein